MSETNLNETKLGNADLTGVLYEPLINALPAIAEIGTAFNLSTMWYEKTPAALEELRRAFKQSGMRPQEREVTYAIKNSEQRINLEKERYLEFLINSIFDVSTDFGLNPGKALLWLFLLIPCFAALYLWAILKSSANHCIYRVWPRERIEIIQGNVVVEEMPKIARLEKGRFTAWQALYFSLLSAFHIGWQDLTLKNWIIRLQHEPYTLQATGRIRTISGLQSLISVLLLAMWLLTYFGRPFE